MIEVIIQDKKPDEIMAIVRELRANGLVQGTDFDFSYSPPDEDWMNGKFINRYTIFKFYSEKHGTLFALKYYS